jgi:hypothetical protein
MNLLDGRVVSESLESYAGDLLTESTFFCGLAAGEPFGGQRPAQGGPYRLLVVDDQDTRPDHRTRQDVRSGCFLTDHGMLTVPDRAGLPRPRLSQSPHRGGAWSLQTAPRQNTMTILSVRIPSRAVRRPGVTDF